MLAKTAALRFISIAFLCAALCAAPRAAHAQTPEEIAAKVAAIASYERSQSRAPLIEIEALVRASREKPEIRQAVTDSLAKLLASEATRDAKLFACRQLWYLGSEPALAALSAMLVDETTADMACYAIAQDPSPKAGQTLRDALPNAKGGAVIAIVNLLGDRHDADAVGPLVSLASGGDEAAAMAAIAALGKIGGENAAQCLSETLKKENATLRAAAMDAYLRCAERFLAAGDRKRAVAIYQELTADAYPANIRKAAQLGIENAKLGDPVVLFDGKTLAGWEGNLEWFRVEDGAVVAGTLQKPIPHNEFLCTEKSFGDFDLHLKVKLLGENANAGIQIRSQRVPNDTEVSGYQADMGQQYWGGLYDESRRNKVLALPKPEELATVLRTNDWNDYVIRCEGKHIQLWLNGFKTVDYTETDDGIAPSGIIGLQIHGGGPSEASYKDIVIRELVAVE